MTNKYYVHYLCYNPSDNTEWSEHNNEFMTARELPDDYYSPGTYYIPLISGKTAESYIFPMAHNGQPTTVELKWDEEEEFYTAKVGDQEIFFTLGKVRGRYIGKYKHPDYKYEFAELITNHYILDQLYLDHKFLFVGHSPWDNDVKPGSV
jgi:hypothetical protein